MADNQCFSHPPYQTYPQQFQWQQPTPMGYWPVTTLPTPSDTPAYLDHSYSAPLPLQTNCTTKAAVHGQKLSASPSPVGDALTTKQRKARAIQACEQCRYRKQKCDEGQPCSFCKENGSECHYRPTMPTKNDKVIECLLSWMTAHADGLQSLKERFESLETYMRTVEPPPQPELRPQTIDPISYLPRTTNSGPGSRSISPQSRTISDRDSSPGIMLWPEVRKVLSFSGVELAEDYVVRAEDRPVLNACRFDQGTVSPTGAGYAREVSSDSDACRHSLDLSCRTVNRLLDAYLLNVHPLHPFLEKRKLVVAVNRFLDLYGEEAYDHQYSGTGTHLAPLAKRRRISPACESRRPRRIERSPANAVVLFVLALGTTSSGVERCQTDGNSMAPGLDYFSKAISVAAEHFDGCELIHAHMFLLAGLYKARQGRVSECGSWYSSASRALVYLIQRHDLIRLYEDATPDSILPKHDSILTAAWICLFLENDNLSELKLPQSGIHRLQESLPFPARFAKLDKGIRLEDTIHGEDAFFAAQIKLQRIFQYIMRLHDDGSFLGERSTELGPTMQYYASALQGWRNSLPSSLKWDDCDSPPTSSLHARLRYRYWEAKFHILRPFLDYILHIEPGVKRGMTLESCSKDARGRPRPSNEKSLLSAIGTSSVESGEGKVLRIAELCVEAAKQCVLSWKNVASAPAGPGSVAIAHSQFHNTLILAAASRCEKLRHLVSNSVLAIQFAASMSLLANLAAISPLCAADHRALMSVHKTLFGAQDEVT